MAAAGDASASTSSASPAPPHPPVALAKEKPIVVRVKRKSSQARLDAFWLEINERPTKKAMLDFSSLSISESSTAKAPEEPQAKKLLVQHVETIHHSEAVEDVLHSLLNPDSGIKEKKSKTKEWNDRIKQDKKQDQLRSTARRKHEDLVRNARFAQIWRSRKRGKDEGEESLREICHLYDAVQVDSEEEKRQTVPWISSFEEGAILCNFLPLIREYLPSAAEEIESDVISLAKSEDCHVYDIYTVKEGDDTNMDDMTTATYPLLQVDDDDDEYYDGPVNSGYDTEDSNAEDNPLFDYPDEEPSDDDKGDELGNPFGDVDGSDSEYEKKEVYVEVDEEHW